MGDNGRDIPPEVWCDASGQCWAGRRISVIGLGRSGRAAAELLVRAGCHVSVTDVQETPALRQAATDLLSHGVEAVELGQHSERLLARSELVVVSPGITETSPPVRWACTHDLPVISEIELAFRFCRCPVIAVTGTNGKSSVVTLIEQVLRASRREAIACGNLGVPFSAVVDRLNPEAVAVVEVSSFQLTWCDTFHPRIAVLLNLGTNHLDRHGHHGNYVRAKARLFQHQGPNDLAVFNGRDPEVIALADHVKATRVWFGENRSNPARLLLCAQTRDALSENTQAVLQVARLLEIPDPLTWQVIRSFRGLEHRMEHVATIRGVSFINDSKSTTPESLIFALRRLRGSVVLIIGGRDKGLDVGSLAEIIQAERVRGVVLIGESRQRVRPLLNGATKVRESVTLEKALQEAVALATPGDTVLLSPAFASFDMFRSFEDRGQAFKSIVHRMEGGGIDESSARVKTRRGAARTHRLLHARGAPQVVG